MPAHILGITKWDKSGQVLGTTNRDKRNYKYG